MSAKFSFPSLAGILLIATAASGQQANLVHAQLDQTQATGGLAAAISGVTERDSGPSWIGYASPAVANHRGNGGEDGWRSCTGDLEEGTSITNNSGDLEAATDRHILIFLRVERQEVERIRMFEDGCRVDADGMPVHWLSGVKPAESVEFLRAFVLRGETNDEKRSDGAAIAAIASTDDPAADAAMQQFTSPPTPDSLRKKAVFWLGAARGAKGYEMLRTIVKQDPSEEVRDRAIFALSISPEPAAVDTLIDEARYDTSAKVRGQALFWLAQKAGKKAASTISSAAENDPDTQVKKRAVFALTQLPADQGVPLLIQVAESNHNLEVRKQAFFWLGQSKDPRALDFIARVLTSDAPGAKN
jgi:hypothetical protein